LELPKLRGSLPKLGTGIRWAGTYLTLQQRFSPEWTVTARGLRGKHIGPGRAVRVGPKLEVPKLQGSLPVLRTGIRWPRHHRIETAEKSEVFIETRTIR